MIYVTGDRHGDLSDLEHFGKSHPGDTVVILGDVGLNYYHNAEEVEKKKRINNAGITVLCVHGNHEQRPYTLPEYTTKEYCGGKVYYEEKFPNILFLKDGEVYNLESNQCLVIGGAYSIDKEYRLLYGWHWFPDEQPSEEIKQAVEDKIQQIGGKVDYVFSHTCPQDFVQPYWYKSQIPDSQIDRTTELWLNDIKNKLDFKRWMFGHHHRNEFKKEWYALYELIVKLTDEPEDIMFGRV